MAVIILLLVQKQVLGFQFIAVKVYLANLHDLLWLLLIILEIILYFFLLRVILVYEDHIRVQFFISFYQMLKLFINFLVFILAALQIFLKFQVRLLHLLKISIIFVKLIRKFNFMKVTELFLEDLVKVLHHDSKSMEDRSLASYVLYKIQNFQDQMVYLFLLVQANRVRKVLSFIHQIIFSLSLQISHLYVFLESSWLVHLLTFNIYNKLTLNVFLIKVINCRQTQIMQPMQKRKSKEMQTEVESIAMYYDFEDTLGEGSFATVWTVTKKTSGQKFAIKQIQVHPLEKQMAYREVQNLQKVQNDHIIKYYLSVYDSSEMTLNVIMQKCSGSLRSQIKDKIFTYKELVSFTTQINSAFLELLNKKLMHLDLKPQNILISKTNPNCYKICDFGCAQIAIQSKLTKYNNQTFGTFNYLAPQNYLEFRGKLTNTSADIWSLGVILYEMVYKKLPLQTDQDGFIKRKEIKQFFQGNQSKIVYPDIPNIPPLFINLIKKMLKAKPKYRITWIKMSEELQKIYDVDEYCFINVRKIYFKHIKISNILLTFIIVIRKNIELNPHQFWKKNKNLLQNFSNTLLHLSYAYCLKFMDINSYKLHQFLEKDWIQRLQFIQKQIQFEQKAFAAKNKWKMTTLDDLRLNEVMLLQQLKEVKKKLNEFQHQNYWETMYDLDLFCQQAIIRLENKSLFAAGDNQNFGETMKNLDIN